MSEESLREHATYLVKKIEAILRMVNPRGSSTLHDAVERLQVLKGRLASISEGDNSIALDQIEREYTWLTLSIPELHRAWDAHTSELIVNSGDQILRGFDSIARERPLTENEVRERERVAKLVHEAKEALRVSRPFGTGT